MTPCPDEIETGVRRSPSCYTGCVISAACPVAKNGNICCGERKPTRERQSLVVEVLVLPLASVTVSEHALASPAAVSWSVPDKDESQPLIDNK